MREIGRRKFEQNAERYVRLAQAGETVQIIERGKPIALITPVRKEEDSPPPSKPADEDSVERVTHHEQDKPDV